jgi:hypothetical protein
MLDEVFSLAATSAKFSCSRAVIDEFRQDPVANANASEQTTCDRAAMVLVRSDHFVGKSQILSASGDSVGGCRSRSLLVTKFLQNINVGACREVRASNICLGGERM